MEILTTLYCNPDKKGQKDEYYFQKSRAFLYPVLGIERSSSIKPIGTYLAWDNISHTDMKLICLYSKRGDAEFEKFHNRKLLGSALFETFYDVEPSAEGYMQRVYIFDFKAYHKDWKWFLAGKYSKFAPELKWKIKSHFKKNTLSHAYIDSFINPAVYISNYSKLLGVPATILREVGELTSKPDLDRERLHIRPKEEYNL